MEHSTTPSVNLCTNIFFKIFGFKSCYISLSKKVVNSSRERGVIIEWTCSSRKKILGKMHDSRHQAFIWSKLLATTSVFEKKKQAIPASLRQIKHNFKIRNHYLSRIFYIAKMALGSTQCTLTPRIFGYSPVLTLCHYFMSVSKHTLLPPKKLSVRIDFCSQLLLYIKSSAQ